MTGLFISIEGYIPDPVEIAVDSAIAKLKRYEMQEEYDYVPSIANNEAVRARLLR